MRKFLTLILISFSLAVLEVDRRRIPSEPVPIVYQLDSLPGYDGNHPETRYFNYSFDLN